MAGTGTGPIREIVTKLHDCCSKTLEKSFTENFDGLNGASYAFSADLDVWVKALDGRPEQALYVTAANEYVLALLNNSQGQYRNAFKSLRLTLELVLQGVYLSANLVALNEWLTSHSDTSWNAILDDDKGIFAKRFSRAFFPSVTDDSRAFKQLSETLYREMSECTHGNVPNKIPLPKTIEFDEPTFLLWHAKAETLRYIANFALTARYFLTLPVDTKAIIVPIITDRLGHLESIRTGLETTT
jgi:hypothetical protein